MSTSILCPFQIHHQIQISSNSQLVLRQRDFFVDLRKRKGLEIDETTGRRRPVPIFIPHAVAVEVNEELSKSMEECYPGRTKPPYPNLPRPSCKGTTFIQGIIKLPPLIR